MGSLYLPHGFCLYPIPAPPWPGQEKFSKYPRLNLWALCWSSGESEQRARWQKTAELWKWAEVNTPEGKGGSQRREGSGEPDCGQSHGGKSLDRGGEGMGRGSTRRIWKHGQRVFRSFIPVLFVCWAFSYMWEITKSINSWPLYKHLGLPWWLSGKEPSCHNARDASSISGLGRSPGGGNGNPLQYSCLGNPKDRGGLRATVRGLQRVGHDWSDLAKIG